MTLSDITRAASDADLIDRVASAAAELGIPAPHQWAEQRARQVCAQPITSSGDTIASVHAYAVATYSPAPSPGADPTKVTDAHIRDAVAKVSST